MDLSITGLLASMGYPALTVLVVMLLMLVGCVYVFFERLIVFLRSRGQSRELAEVVSKPLAAGDIAGALKLIGSEQYKAAYLGAVLKAGLGELKIRMDEHGVEAAERALERSLGTETSNLRKGMNILATTGSTTPFVGLVGTIFGIITAFSKMSEAGGGDLTAISGGIAEALVSTAVGIVIAIVGVWMYNYFNAVIDDISKDMTTSAQELVDWAKKEVLRRSEAAAK
ncbi:MAG TPA: MotA/TolQ/ExbB proton channel family protein [Myxococcota bacterium]|nr:MotA/TolQ/ExbB proton channel family protein [Myxococcota bacterium]